MPAARIVINDQVLFDNDLGAWQENPPDFMKDLIEPSARPAPWFKTILIAMAEAALIDHSVVISVVAVDPYDWTMRVKVISPAEECHQQVSDSITLT